uniref:Uncharacterized protein n=1 Tax=Fabrea salina TaxID=342563 RepID=A0A7S3MRQ6_9CILI|mmetsp:Transcript_121/g.225  ORF Transcript_121/g.225 Transcript_121/m.225 type:complete len:206 (+) Transcript_121:465-1082(+)
MVSCRNWKQSWSCWRTMLETFMFGSTKTYQSKVPETHLLRKNQFANRSHKKLRLITQVTPQKSTTGDSPGKDSSTQGNATKSTDRSPETYLLNMIAFDPAKAKLSVPQTNAKCSSESHISETKKLEKKYKELVYRHNEDENYYENIVRELNQEILLARDSVASSQKVKDAKLVLEELLKETSMLKSRLKDMEFQILEIKATLGYH